MCEFKPLSNIGYYKCFSPNVYRYLKQNGFRYITKNTHGKTGRTYFEFEINDELDKALKQFSRDKELYFNKN